MTEGPRPLQERPRDCAQFRAFFDALPKDLPKGADDLGEPVAIHRTSRGLMIAGICLGSFFMAAGVVVGCLLFANASNMRSTDLNALSIGAGLAFLAGLFMAAVCFFKIRSPSVVVVFRDGFIRAAGNDVTIAPWAEIENVWESITEYVYNGQPTMIYAYSIELTNGEKLGFNSMIDTEVSDVRKLGKTIQDEVTRFKLPDALHRLEQGETISFGSIALNKEGIRFSNRLAPWQEIEEVFVEEGTIVVQKLGQSAKWAEIAAAEIPNVRVLLALVHGIQSPSAIEAPSSTQPEAASDRADQAPVDTTPLERIPNTRTYIHMTCAKATIVSWEDFLSLADPFSGVSLTVCAACDGAFALADFQWEDTGENMVTARRRIAAGCPSYVRFLNSYVFLGIFGVACGVIAALVSRFFPSKHVSSPWAELLLFAVGLFVGLVAYFGFLARPLTKMLMGVDFDFRKLR